jgi:hypothetical protein
LWEDRKSREFFGHKCFEAADPQNICSVVSPKRSIIGMKYKIPDVFFVERQLLEN